VLVNVWQQGCHCFCSCGWIVQIATHDALLRGVHETGFVGVEATHGTRQGTAFPADARGDGWDGHHDGVLAGKGAVARVGAGNHDND